MRLSSVALLTGPQESIAFAERYDEAAGHYRGLCSERKLNIADHTSAGLLVNSEVALKQIDAEAPAPGGNGGLAMPVIENADEGQEGIGRGSSKTEPSPRPRRYHRTVSLDPDALAAMQVA